MGRAHADATKHRAPSSAAVGPAVSGSPRPEARQLGHATPVAPKPARQLRVAYVMSRFPRLSETFVLYEILALERRGVAVELYPLLREQARLVHPEAVALVERARYLPFLSPSIVRSQIHFLRRRPRAYLGALGDLLRGTWGSLNFLVGAIGIFPKVVHAARLMAADGVTHVHCHFANHPAAAGFLVHRLTGIPYSFTAHGSDLHVDRHMLREKVEEAEFVVAVSNYNRDIILEECGRRFADKVIVLHCGVDTDVFRPEEAPRPESPFRILCVGTLHEVKGQAYLVEACRLLADKGMDFACHLVGDGPDRPALERRIAEAGLGERIVLTGSLTREEVAALLRKADVLAAPSVLTRSGKREGIPVVLMEALGSGVPAVASDLSGIPELVQDGVTGLLVPPGNAEALASALTRLAGDPELRRRLGLAGREKVLAEFDVETNAAALAGRFAAEAIAS